MVHGQARYIHGQNQGFVLFVSVVSRYLQFGQNFFSFTITLPCLDPPAGNKSYLAKPTHTNTQTHTHAYTYTHIGRL